MQDRSQPISISCINYQHKKTIKISILPDFYLMV